MNTMNWVMPKYQRELLKSWIRRIVAETLERYGIIPPSDVDPTSGVQRLQALYAYLTSTYPNAFQFKVLDLDDGSKTLIITSDTVLKMDQLRAYLASHGLPWADYFNGSQVIEGDYNLVMMLNSYEVTQ